MFSTETVMERIIFA